MLDPEIAAQKVQLHSKRCPVFRASQSAFVARAAEGRETHGTADEYDLPTRTQASLFGPEEMPLAAASNSGCWPRHQHASIDRAKPGARPRWKGFHWGPRTKAATFLSALHEPFAFRRRRRFVQLLSRPSSRLRH